MIVFNYCCREPSPDNSSASAHQKSLTEEEIMELLGEDESNDGSCNMVRSDGKNGKMDKKKPDLVETGGTEADDIGLDEAFVEGRLVCIDCDVKINASALSV